MNTLTHAAHTTGAKAKTLLHKVENKARTGGDFLEDKAYEMGAKAKEYLERGQETFEEGSDYLEDRIKSRPFVAAGVAFVAGMVIGRLFGCKR